MLQQRKKAKVNPNYICPSRPVPKCKKMGFLQLQSEQELKLFEKEEVEKIIFDKKKYFQYQIAPFLFSVLKHAHSIHDRLKQSSSISHLYDIMEADLCCFQMGQRLTLIKLINSKQLKMIIYERKIQEWEKIKTFNFSSFPEQIHSSKLLSHEGLPFIVACGGTWLFWTHVHINQEGGKIYALNCEDKIKKIVPLNQTFLILLACGKLMMTSITKGQQNFISLSKSLSKLKVKQIEGKEENAAILTQNYHLIIINSHGQIKKRIRTGVQIGNLKIVRRDVFLVQGPEESLWLLRLGQRVHKIRKLIRKELIGQIDKCQVFGQWVLVQNTLSSIFAINLDRKGIVVRIFPQTIQKSNYFALLYLLAYDQIIKQ